MDNLHRTIAKYAFYLTAIALLAWTMSLTYRFVAGALPEMPWYVPAFSLILFDVGMLAWMVTFLSYAEGSGQRAIALLTCVLDMIGVGLMAVAEIMLGGQQLAQTPQHLGEYAVYAIGGWTVANVISVVLFHLLSPEARKAMMLQATEDKIFDRALKQTESKADAIAGELANELSDAMLGNIIRTLRSSGEQDVPARLRTVAAADAKSTPSPAPAKLEPPTIPFGSAQGRPIGSGPSDPLGTGPPSSTNGHGPKEADSDPL